MPVLSLSGQEAIEAYLQNAAMSEAQKTADRMMAGIAGVGNQDTESGERKLKEDTAGQSAVRCSWNFSIAVRAAIWEMEYDE